MSTTLVIKQNDLLPRLAFTLYDVDVPVDLTLATEVSLVIRGLDGIKVQAPVTLADQSVLETRGMGHYDWVAGDTDTVGIYKAEVRVVWPGDLPQTFPAGGYFTVKIIDDLRED